MMQSTLRRPGVVNLATMAFAQSADLVQSEFRLARAELAEKMAGFRSALVMILMGAIFLIAALGLVLQALVSLLIAAGLSPAAAVLVVAGAAAAIGIGLFVTGQNRLDPDRLTPDRTLTSLTRDTRMVKEQLT
ncbi:MAG: phage holin family protein [Reyranellaceae bacterium]